MKICDESQCFGCCGCMNICPKGAISMVENDYGALIPQVDMDKCIDCGLCQKVCPVISPLPHNPEGRCYAAWSNDPDVCKTSASAGIVTTLARRVIANKGVVFGTRYECGSLVFDYTETEEGLDAFRGSKYVHAYVGVAYQKVKAFLKQERIVLFVGTPCQVAALKNYLGQDNAKLLTVDLICHGVAPVSYLREYVKDALKLEPVDNVLFRGEWGEALALYRNGKAVKVEKKIMSPFYMAYVKGLLHRENCYSCPFASINRCGDITAGDFWGLNRDVLKEDSSGVSYVSMVMVNSTKGACFFNNMTDTITAEERPLNEALAGNGQLQRPCHRHPDRDGFLNCYQNGGFNRTLRKTSFYRKMRVQSAKYAVRLLLHKIKRSITKHKET